jgi:nascent polypeptide-associated complex subunit alpha
MIPGINPKDLAKAMKKMGIQQEDLPATEVIIKMQDKELIISNPQVAKVNMMGQETYQITGEAVERHLEPSITEDDVQAVVEQTGVSHDEALEAIKKHDGDLAAAILELKGE